MTEKKEVIETVAEKTESKPQTQSGPQAFVFPQVQGDAFSQFDPATGWFWIGLRIPAFDMTGAKEFIAAQGFQLWQVFRQLQQAAVAKSKLVQPGGIRGVFNKLKQ